MQKTFQRLVVAALVGVFLLGSAPTPVVQAKGHHHHKHKHKHKHKHHKKHHKHHANRSRGHHGNRGHHARRRSPQHRHHARRRAPRRLDRRLVRGRNWNRRTVVNRTWTNRYWNNSYNLSGAARYTPSYRKTYTYWPSNYYQYIRPPANTYSSSYQWPTQYQLYGVPAGTQQISIYAVPGSTGDPGLIPTQAPNLKQPPRPGPKGKTAPKGATKAKS